MGNNKPQRKEGGRPQWMVVYVTNDTTEAQVVAGRLQHEGIQAILDQMTGRDAIGITIGTWGEVRVLVHPNDYDAALDILFPEEPPELDDQVHDDDTIYYDDWDADEDDDHDDD